MGPDINLEHTRRRLAAERSMDAPPGRITSTRPAFCAICARKATVFAVHPQPGKLVMWLCSDQTCWTHAIEVVGMRNAEWLQVEQEAAALAMTAGKPAQLFCKSAGVTDFKIMTPDQRKDFALALLEGYRASMIEVLHNHAFEVPF